jgi:hypothetical protein
MVVRSAPQYLARNPLVNHTTSILDPIALHEQPTEPFRMRVWSNMMRVQITHPNKEEPKQLSNSFPQPLLNNTLLWRVQF